MDRSILVVGCGSIGSRHLRNLRSLGVQQLAACDVLPERLEPLVEELGVRPFSDFEEAVNVTSPDCVFVCTPPVYHVAQALRALRGDAHVFVEKPLSHALDGTADLLAEAVARHRLVQVGYNFRFHPGLAKIRGLIEEGAIGRVLLGRAEVGQYLPDWRPLQDYRESYTARRGLGGGIILDASHELDYMMWLMGRPVEVACMAGRVSNLEVDVEDAATVLLRFARGGQASISMDFVQRAYSRSCKFVGEEGTLVWDYPTNRIDLYQADQSRWETLPYEFEANQMYLDEVSHFLAEADGESLMKGNLRQGIRVLRVALAAHESATEKRWVSLERS